MKIIRIVSIVICTLFVLSLVFPFPICKSVSALMVSMIDETLEKQVTITYDGYYYINLFKNDEFSGKIIVSDFEETNQKIIGRVEITNQISHAASQLEYEDAYRFGQLISNRFLTMSVIPVYEHPKDLDSSSFNYAEGIYLVTGVMDRDSALKLINEILDNQ